MLQLGDMKPDPVLWHEDNVERGFVYLRFLLAILSFPLGHLHTTEKQHQQLKKKERNELREGLCTLDCRFNEIGEDLKWF